MEIALCSNVKYRHVTSLLNCHFKLVGKVPQKVRLCLPSLSIILLYRRCLRPTQFPSITPHAGSHRGRLSESVYFEMAQVRLLRHMFSSPALGIIFEQKFSTLHHSYRGSSSDTKTELNFFPFSEGIPVPLYIRISGVCIINIFVRAITEDILDVQDNQGIVKVLFFGLQSYVSVFLTVAKY